MTPLTQRKQTPDARCRRQARDASAATSVSQIPSHARWLPAAHDHAEKRFWYEPLLESGIVPDAVIRAAIRRMLRDRLREEDRGSAEANRAKLLAFVDEMKRSPIALRTDSANAQHYEVPAAFFQSVLGPRLKYSSAFFSEGCDSLAPGGRGDAAADLRARGTCRRPQYSGARLRLGFADALDGRAFSEQRDHRSFQFGVAARLHRIASRAARSCATCASSPPT